MPPSRRSTRSLPWRGCRHLLPTALARNALSPCSPGPLLRARPLCAATASRPPRSCADSSPPPQVIEVPESLLQKGKCEEQWAADRKEKALADRKKALESCKIILTRAKQYVQDYDAQ
ncbi:hypothetical protein PAHAL_2G159700 [Panicum hallii]|uniref:Large ribosomal subunit protein uL30 N-terminal eukaryotes domain-containing protein n=1 Tax=Panicum hallii TaxID=206008 RepID=A0A2S3GYQ0_9POAL|nr:uncharacterized protein LOC112883351 [Panicum hallii]PAN11482.1 hypothetical protein PAHAL_2G159700 [Panicum hallii]